VGQQDISRSYASAPGFEQHAPDPALVVSLGPAIGFTLNQMHSFSGSEFTSR
jgi:hypothetical protein